MRILLAVVLFLAAGCSADEPDRPVADAGTDTSVDDSVVDLGPPPCAPHSVFGSHAVGVRTMTIAGATTAVFYPAAAGDAYETYDLRDWMLPEDQDKIPDDVAPRYEYPAYRDASPVDGPFPVVLFSHGFGGYRLQSSVLMATIASWGYIVFAPEHPERNLTSVLESGVPTTDNSPATLLALLDELESATPAGIGEIDLEQAAVVGHSAGGFAAMSVGADPRFDLVVGWATANFADVPDFSTPTTIIAGGADRISQAAGSRQLYESRVAPRIFAIIDNAGHLAFSDICLIGREAGGVLAIAGEYGVRVPAILSTLAKDGCLPQDLPAEESWPLTNHLTISSLEHHLRGGPPVDTAKTLECFGELVAELDTE